MSVKMFYFVLVWAAVSGVAVVLCDVSEDNYNVISTMLKSPLRVGQTVHTDLDIGKLFFFFFLFDFKFHSFDI